MNSFFFWLSKLVWLIISPDNLLVLLICISSFLLYRKAFKAVLILQSIISICVLIIAFFPIGEWLLSPLETRFQTNPKLPEHINGIIVLSGAENAILSAKWKQIELNEASERNLVFLQLARHYPKAKLIFTGGSGKLLQQKYKEAFVAKKLFEEQGFNTEQIIFETNSRNTYENALFSYALIKPKINENWLLITSAWHMPRAMGVFKQLNWNVSAYPVDHRSRKNHLFRIDLNFSVNLHLLTLAIREWLGIIVYYCTGKSSFIL